ncbi:MAG TPA: NAD(P)H-binding protein [Prolixibacteraceae bacterium]
MKRIANVIGGSGLVGRQLVFQLLEMPEYEKVRSFVRRPSGIAHPKLEEIIIDFNKPHSWTHLVQGDVLFSTLGTTIKAAKTKENQYKVDFSYQFEFAWAAFENRIPDYVLVSSIGADPNSSFFYSRIKGELEAAVSVLSFRKLIIFRPSILDGNRIEKRPGEKVGLAISRLITRLMLKKYQPTPVNLLAERMARVVLDPSMGVQVIEGSEILAM